MRISIDNYRAADGTVLSTAQRAFTVREIGLGEESFKLTDAGAQVEAAERTRLERVLRAVTSQSAGPERAAPLMALHARRIANRLPVWVGRNLMVSCIPRDLAEPTDGAFVLGVKLGPPELGHATVYSLSEDDHRIQHAPIVIDQGIMAADGMVSHNPAHYANWPELSKQPAPRTKRR